MNDRIIDYLSRNQWDREVVEEVQRSYFWDRIDPGDIHTAIDVGGHIGSWSFHLKLLNPDVQIGVIEVDPGNAERARLNLQRWDNITVIEARCGYESGDYVLGKHPWHGAAHACFKREDVPQVQRADPGRTFVEIARTVTLEDVMAEAGMSSVDLLKLDCEGAEIEIVRDIDQATLDGIQRIVGEIHVLPHEFDHMTDQRLQRNGFKVIYEPHPAHNVLHYFMAWREA